jgi:hypothetical protein
MLKSPNVPPAELEVMYSVLPSASPKAALVVCGPAEMRPISCPAGEKTWIRPS